MSTTTPDTRTEPGQTQLVEAGTHRDCDVQTSGTESGLCLDLLTQHPLVIRRPRAPTSDLDWADVLAASEATSLSFLADEPDLYGEEDGERI